MVGVDVGKTAFYASMMGSSWEDFDILYFERDDIREFIDELKKLPFDEVVLVVEPTGTYQDGLLNEAREAQLGLHRISGSHVKNSESLFDNAPSLHDGKAAYLLGRLYLCGVGTEWKASTEEQRDLRALANIDRMIEKNQQMLTGPLEAHLARHFPELPDYLDLQSATLLELIGRFGSAGKMAKHPDEARDLMQRVSRGALKDEKIEQIIEVAPQTIGQEPTEQQRATLQYIANTLRQVTKGANRLHKQIEKTAEQDERTEPLCEFVGKRTAVIFVALLGGLTEYSSSQQLEKAFGMNLGEYSTGQTKEDKRRDKHGLSISKRGPSRARKMLYFWRFA